jgi:hypothetical protein
MITPTRKRIVYKELAELFAKEGVDKIPDTKTLLTYDIKSMNNMIMFKKIFNNFGEMMRVVTKAHPDLMKKATSKPKVTPKPKAEIKPKAEAKPAAKSAVKKGK